MPYTVGKTATPPWGQGASARPPPPTPVSHSRRRKKDIHTFPAPQTHQAPKKIKKALAHHIHTCYIAQMRRRNLYIPDQLMDRVQKLAKRKNVPMADIIRTAMEKYMDAVDRAEAKAKEAANA